MSVYDVSINALDGSPVDLHDFEDREVLLVNVASKCGLTPQYTGLEELQKRYADRGFTVLGVPCNQFGGQEPGSSEEIAEFCKANYGVEFDMLSKVNVNGEKAAPLYKYLTSKETDPKFAGDIKWNFEKFVFDRQGNVVARFPSKVKPDDKEVVDVIEAKLAEKPKS